MFDTCIITIHFPKDIRTVIDNMKRIFIFSVKIAKLYFSGEKADIFIAFFMHQLYINYSGME